MKTNKFDITKVIEDLTESEKMRVYGFILGLKENREQQIKVKQESGGDYPSLELVENSAQA